MLSKFSPCIIWLAITLCPLAAAGESSDEGQADEKLTMEVIAQDIGQLSEEDENYAERAHHYLGNKADDLAIYLDRFFGAPQEDLESADTTVRLTTRFEYDEDDGWETKLRARGNIQLPAVSKRLSIAFNAEEDDFRSSYDPDEDRNVAALQFTAYDAPNSRFDMTLGVTSGPNLKPGVRYRYKNSFTDHDRHRYTGRFLYSDKRRFHQIHQLDFDYATGDTSAVRWANRLYHGQRSEGAEWGTLLVWRYGYNVTSAFMAAVGVLGATEPEVPEDIPDADPALNGGALVTNAGGWLLFRKRLYKDWLYVNFSPGYTERKRHHYEDRHGVFFARLDFEITLNRGREQERKSSDRVAGLLSTGHRLPF